MVCQQRISKKCSRKGLRRSTRLSNLNSRPKLDIIFEKSQPKSQQTKTLECVNDRYNLRTRPPPLSGAKPSFSRNSQEDRSRKRNLVANAKLTVKSVPPEILKTTIIDDNRRTTRSQSYSKANDKSSYPESVCFSTNEAKLEASLFAENSPPVDVDVQPLHHQLPTQTELFTDSMCPGDQLEAPELPKTEFADVLSTPGDDYDDGGGGGDGLKLPPPLFEVNSLPDELADFGDSNNELMLQSQPVKNYLHSADVNVRPRRQLKWSANVPKKTDNAEKKSQKMKREFSNAAKSFESEPKKINAPVLQKLRYSQRLNKVNPEKDEEKTNAVADRKQELASNDIEENESNVDDLCMQFETCRFTSEPEYFVKDQKLSLDNYLLNVRSQNVMSQKFNELNDVKSSKVNKQIPNLIPIIFTQGVGATFDGDFVNNGLPDSVDSSDCFEIHNILKSITHVYSKIPSYEPLEENWYEGFDSWSK